MKTQFSENRDELFAALSKAQAAMSGVEKEAENPFFKSKYADLNSCLEAMRKPFADNDLCLTQATSNEGGSVTVETTIGHASGQWQCGTLTMTPEKAGPQAMGSCLTYARRYALTAMVGLAQVDMDAEPATNRTKKKDGEKQVEVIPEKVWGEAELAARGGLKDLEAWFTSQPKPVRALTTKDAKRWATLKERASARSAAGAIKRPPAEDAA